MPDLEEHYADLRAVVAEFADEVVAPVAAEHDREHSFPYEVVAQMGAMGLFGLPFSEEYGGMGSDFFALALALEELGRVDQSVAITLEAAVGLGAMPIYRFGTDDQKARWLPDLLSGRALAGFGLTEAGAGTDAAALRTTAARDADEWVINGAKQFITNSGTDITSLVLVAAATGPAADGLRASRSGADRYADRAAIGSERTAGNREISTLIVPAGTPGFTVEPAYDKVGWRASDTHPLTFSGARVPADHLLGERGRGYANFLATLDEGRIALAALATGAAQGCVNESVKYARQRESFGRPIGAFQSVSFKIARMQARAHTARCAYHDAARLLLAGKPFKQQAAIAKLVASEAAMDNARDATQIHGGYGFMNEYPVARHYRDSKVLEIGEGTSEVQLMVIARELGL